MPETTVSPFRPAALPGPSSRASEDRDERSRAAGYAAGWTAGARAAAEVAAQRARELEAKAVAEQARRQAALDHALAVLSAAVDAVEARTVPIVREARATLHSTALDLAAAVLQHELRPGPDSARVLLERALDLPVELGVHTVRVNPVDLAHCETVLRSGQVQLPEGTRLVADPRLAPGDTMSEYQDGFLDGQVQTALDRARAVLREDQA